MATMKISSSDDAFSFVIRKNPASGMIAKNIRKGTAFGWFSDPHTYCVAFFDGMDEMSFAKRRNQEFAFIDQTRYNAPLFLSVALREFFQTALRTQNAEQDVAGSTLSLQVSSIEIERMEVFQKIIPCFPGFNIETTPLSHEQMTGTNSYDNYFLKITTDTRTLHELLNLGYLLGYLIATCSHVEFQVEQGILLRLIEACNILDAPYYVRHLIRSGCIHSLDDFRKAEAALNTSKTARLKMSPDTNAGARFRWIRDQLNSDMDILDFGCGEGKFFPLANNIPSSTYYAIDRDEGARDAAKKSVERREIENIIVLDDMDSFIQMDTGRDFTVIMSEVFEHNEPSEMKDVMRSLFDNPHCANILITTPNRDFNPNYFLKDNELRHPYHVFEMTRDEAEKYFSKLVQGTDFACTMSELGDVVDGVPSILAFTLTNTRRGGSAI